VRAWLGTLGRIVTRAFLGVLLLLVVVIGLAGALLGTSTGLSWLLQQANGKLPGSIQVASVEGGLFGRLRLQQISYQTAEMQAGADELILHWFPAELFRGRFHIAELSVRSPIYTQLIPAREPAAPESEGTPALPDITLPIEILLDRVEVTDVRYLAEARAKPVTVSRASLRAGWNAEGIRLHTLELEMPGIGLSVQGKVLPQGQYPLDLQTRLSLAMPDAPKAQAQGRIRGDLGKLNIEQDVSGDIQAALSATLEEPLSDLHWRSSLDLQGLLLQSVTPENHGRLAGSLRAAGNLARAEAEGKLRLEDAADLFSPWQTDWKLTANLEKPSVELHRLVVTRPDTPMELALSGTVDAELNFAIAGHWSALQWPPSGPAQFGSEVGELDLTGTPEDYRLSLHAKLAGTDIPTGVWRVRGQGNQEQFAIETLEGETLGGSLAATGKVAWAPAVSWDATLTAAGINPGIQYPEWPGKLDLGLSSAGSIQEGKPAFTAVIDRLNGSLRERRLDGSGRVQIQGEEITLENVRLSSGTAVVSADGKLGSRSDLAWNLDVADMADLAPGAAGAIRGSGSVTGAMLEPNIYGTLAAQDLRFQELALQSLAADVKLDLSDQTVSRVDLRSAGITFGAEAIPSLVVQAEGRKQDHRLEARVQHALAEVALRLRGAYAETTSAWSGQVQDLGIQSNDFGNWTLQQPAKIAAAPGDLKLGRLCLVREPGLLCAEGELQKDKGSAQLSAKDWQLEWLQAFLPPEIEHLDGTLGLTANATLDKVPNADARITIEPGKIVVRPGGAKRLTLTHQGGQVNAKLDAQRLAATFNLDIGQDGLRGRVSIPRGPLDTDMGTAPLGGAVELRFRQLELLAGLVPAIQEISGDIRADLALGGTLGEPSIQGAASLDLPSVKIPDAGLDLRDVLVRAESDNGRHMHLDGGITSGKGRLDLGGDIELDAAQSWPMLVTLRGKDFQLLNLPDKNARIATDLAFRSGSEGMALTGTVEIPRAYLVVDAIPEGAIQPSSDVIVETGADGAAEARQKGAPFAIQVTVIAGNNVQFRGFGLKAYFEGKLTVSQAPGEFPTGSGELRVKEGSFQAYGQNLTIERGILAYSGGRIDNPGLIVRASREARVDLRGQSTDVTVGVDVSGTAKRPELSVFSTPPMEERDAMSILLTGNTADSLGEGGGSIGIGKELTKDLSVGAEYDVQSGRTDFVTKYRINRKLHVEATTSSETSAADVFYSIEFD